MLNICFNLELSGNINFIYKNVDIESYKVYALYDNGEEVYCDLVRNEKDNYYINLKNLNNNKILTDNHIQNINFSSSGDVVISQFIIGNNNICSSNNITENRSFTIYFEGRRCPNIIVSGNSNVKIKDLKQNDFKVITSGNSNVIFSGKVELLDIISSGNSSIVLSGEANNLNIFSSGNSDVNALKLKVSESENLKCKGNSKIYINSSKI